MGLVVVIKSTSKQMYYVGEGYYGSNWSTDVLSACHFISEDTARDQYLFNLGKRNSEWENSCILETWEVSARKVK